MTRAKFIGQHNHKPVKCCANCRYCIKTALSRQKLCQKMKDSGIDIIRTYTDYICDLYEEVGYNTET